MIAGNERKRGDDGRYKIEQRCDACTKPIHGEHFTDDDVCDGSDDPGFFLCGRKRCGKLYQDLGVTERRALFTLGRARAEAIGT